MPKKHDLSGIDWQLYKKYLGRDYFEVVWLIAVILQKKCFTKGKLECKQEVKFVYA